MPAARVTSPLASVIGLPTSRTMSPASASWAAAMRAAASSSALARASAGAAPHSARAERAVAKAPPTAARSAAGAVTTTSSGCWGERLSIASVLMSGGCPGATGLTRFRPEACG